MCLEHDARINDMYIHFSADRLRGRLEAADPHNQPAVLRVAINQSSPLATCDKPSSSNTLNYQPTWHPGYISSNAGQSSSSYAHPASTAPSRKSPKTSIESATACRAKRPAEPTSTGRMDLGSGNTFTTSSRHSWGARKEPSRTAPSSGKSPRSLKVPLGL
jgi:hypothetical protein